MLVLVLLATPPHPKPFVSKALLGGLLRSMLGKVSDFKGLCWVFAEGFGWVIQVPD